MEKKPTAKKSERIERVALDRLMKEYAKLAVETANFPADLDSARSEGERGRLCDVNLPKRDRMRAIEHEIWRSVESA